MANTIFTIGYEGASLNAFVATLTAARVKRIIDVRDVPSSRKPGFSKNALAAELRRNGIDYTHLKALGDPKDGREAMRRGDRAAFAKVYSDHILKDEAQDALRFAAILVARQPSALLCYEKNANDCHRNLIVNILCKDGQAVANHLMVNKDSVVSTSKGHLAGAGISLAA